VLVRQLIAVGCAGIGVLFLCINAVLLSRGASKWGIEAWERISYGAVAATVPFVIAAMPLIIMLSWRPGRRFGRPSLLTVIGCMVWLVFVAYNLAGASGSIALVRDDVVSARRHMASVQSADETMRAHLTGELHAIPRHRPAGTVAPLISAKKAAPEFERTEKCQDIRRPRERKFCDELTSLESELASARQAQDLTARLAALNAKIETKGAQSEKADPAARVIASLAKDLGFSWDEGYISERLPLATPIILEIGSMTLIYFACVLWGIGHADLAHTKVSRRAPQQQSHPTRLQLPAAPKSSLTRQQELASWFFRECVRPMTTGAMPESDWYRHYQEVCQQSEDIPLPLASFRRLAERSEVLQVQQIEGVWTYLGALPYVPRRAA